MNQHNNVAEELMVSSTKKKILFLFANDVVRKKLADPERLQSLMQEASVDMGKDMEFFTSYARSLSFFISNDKVKIRDHRNHMDLEEYDFVYFRKAGTAMQQMLTCALYLGDHEVPFYDSEIAKSTSRNKLSQMYILQQRGIPVPTTLFCRNGKRLLRLVTKRYAKDLQFPVIAKATAGTRGDANYLVKSAEELDKLVRDESRQFLIQEFIENDGDFRYFVAGGGLLGAIGRQAVGDSHLNNTSQGGSAALFDVNQIPTSVRSDALSAALAFGREVAGVDVIFNKVTGAHYILEVNRAPQIEHASFEQEKAHWMVSAIDKTISVYQSPHSTGEQQSILGRFEGVHVLTSSNGTSKVIAKVDTGADSSSVHATDLTVRDGMLICLIAGEEFAFGEYVEKKIRSSNGQWEQRYLVTLPVSIGRTIYNMKVTLTDRSNMQYEMLIGRRFLRTHNMMVDVGRRYVASGKAKEVKL